jgi:hypothetical protein
MLATGTPRGLMNLHNRTNLTDVFFDLLGTGPYDGTER